MKCRTVFSALATALVLLVSTPLQAASVSIVAPSTAQQGSVFNIDVMIDDVLDLYAFQFDLSFDPSVLQALSVNEGGLLPSGGTTFFAVLGDVDNTTGLISGIANTLVGPIAGVNGNGLLVSISFRGIAEGVSSVDVVAPLFLNSALEDIEVTSTSASVTITPRADVPLPDTLTLMLAGLLGLVLARFAWREPVRA
jgi:Cohesin domain